MRRSISSASALRSSGVTRSSGSSYSAFSKYGTASIDRRKNTCGKSGMTSARHYVVLDEPCTKHQAHDATV